MRRLLYFAPLVVLLAIWHLYTTGHPERQFIFSSPEKVWAALVHLIQTGELVSNTIVTVSEAILGFALGTTLGAIAGLSLWYSRTVAKIAQPYLTALAAVPIFSLAPMIICWFGIGMLSKVALAFLSTVVLAIVQSYQGAMTVESRYMRLMQVVGASRFQTFRIVVIPSALIWVINAMKLNIGLALLGAFIGEFISAENGLGYMIVKASGLYDMATVLVGVLALIAVSLLLTGIVEVTERKLLRWRQCTAAEQEARPALG